MPNLSDHIREQVAEIHDRDRVAAQNRRLSDIAEAAQALRVALRTQDRVVMSVATSDAYHRLCDALDASGYTLTVDDLGIR